MAETNAETDGTEHAQLAGALADARRRIAELEALAAERSHAQEESRQDQRLYRELFEDSLGLMCVHDLDGVLLIVNPAAAQSLGFRPEERPGWRLAACQSGRRPVARFPPGRGRWREYEALPGAGGPAPLRRLPGSHPPQSQRFGAFAFGCAGRERTHLALPERSV